MVVTLGPRVTEEHAELEKQVVGREFFLLLLLVLHPQLPQPLYLELAESAAVIDWLDELSACLETTVFVVRPSSGICHALYIAEPSLADRNRTTVETLTTGGCDNSFCIPSIDDLDTPGMKHLLT